MKHPDCITESELESLAERGELLEGRQTHLDTCVECRALVEQLSTFDPEAAARTVFANYSYSRLMRTERMHRRRSQWSVALGSMAVLILVFIVTRGYVRGRDKTAAFFEQASADATTELLQKEGDAVTLKKVLADIAIPHERAAKVNALLDRLISANEQPPIEVKADGPLLTFDDEGRRYTFSAEDISDRKELAKRFERLLIDGHRVSVHFPAGTEKTTINVALESLTDGAPKSRATELFMMASVRY